MLSARHANTDDMDLAIQASRESHRAELRARAAREQARRAEEEELQAYFDSIERGKDSDSEDEGSSFDLEGHSGIDLNTQEDRVVIDILSDEE